MGGRWWTCANEFDKYELAGEDSGVQGPGGRGNVAWKGVGSAIGWRGRPKRRVASRGGELETDIAIKRGCDIRKVRGMCQPHGRDQRNRPFHGRQLPRGVRARWFMLTLVRTTSNTMAALL